jgi:hypothetical protein
MKEKLFCRNDLFFYEAQHGFVNEMGRKTRKREKQSLYENRKASDFQPEAL